MSGRLKKIGPNRYRVIHTSDTVKKKRKGKPWALTERRQPVPEDFRDPNKKYCECGRELNSGNRSGICVQCREKK